MTKIAFLGAGSTVFAKNVLGDCMHAPALQGAELALIDLSPVRLKESELLITRLNQEIGAGCTIKSYLSTDAAEALADADFAVNAIQVGGYEPSTVIDFEIPKKYGLRQTIGDTLGIGGIFRALRTIPVMLDYCHIMEQVAPKVQLLNYSNPMAMLTGALLKGSSVRTVGLCHSVQGCATHLCRELDLPTDDLQWQVAGINHQGWLLEISRHGVDLYPEIKRRAELPEYKMRDAVRFEQMKWFGYYHTESSEHAAEYTPWFIKAKAPELIERFGIPLDEYPRRCRLQIQQWELQRRIITGESIEGLSLFGQDKPEGPMTEHLKRYLQHFLDTTPGLEQVSVDDLFDAAVTGQSLKVGDRDVLRELLESQLFRHERSSEYASHIMEAMVTDVPYTFGGNVLNKGLITNLPTDACVEVMCVADRSGVHPTYVGDLPVQLAALNRTSINVQEVTIQAALTRKKEHIYQAAMLDPHTAAELTIDEIVAMCDDLIEAHGDMMPQFS
ncbi:MAG: alpha-glucosidase/alpha-galactosidase [Anaerolineales bacterium]